MPPVSAMDLRLRPLQADDEVSARAAHAELSREDFSFLLEWNPDEPWAVYLERLRQRRCGNELAPDWVPSTFLAATVDAELVGRTSIRHDLNDYLAAFGGHIGYAVRPAHRTRGYAREILRQSLVIAHAEGIERILVICHEDNIASARVIDQLGGVLEEIRPSPDGRLLRRYWID